MPEPWDSLARLQYNIYRRGWTVVHLKRDVEAAEGRFIDDFDIVPVLRKREKCIKDDAILVRAREMGADMGECVLNLFERLRADIPMEHAEKHHLLLFPGVIVNDAHGSPHIPGLYCIKGVWTVDLYAVDPNEWDDEDYFIVPKKQGA